MNVGAGLTPPRDLEAPDTKSTGGQFLGPDGPPLTNPMTATAGSSFTPTDVDYVGTHKRHASTPTA